MTVKSVKLVVWWWCSPFPNNSGHLFFLSFTLNSHFHLNRLILVLRFCLMLSVAPLLLARSHCNISLSL